MTLSDRDIKARLEGDNLVIDGMDDPDVQIQPASVDLRLSNKFCRYCTTEKPVLDTRVGDFDDLVEEFEVPEGEPLILQPGDFVLGSTMEWIGMPLDLKGHIQGRSSLARLGITTSCMAGLIDPGSFGVITLQLSNLGLIPVALYPGMRICQISFELMTTPVERPYGEAHNSKYQGSTGPTASKITQDPDKGVPINNIQTPEPYPSGVLYKGQGPNGLTKSDKEPSPPPPSQGDPAYR